MKNIGVISLCLFAMICLFFMESPISRAESARVTLLGEFSRVDSEDGEHCDGYDVELWNNNGSLIGLIHHHRGLCGDPPAGLIEGVSYDNKTGYLSFQAKLSDGWTGLNSSEPTKDIIAFRGTLSDKTLKGRICWKTLNANTCLRQKFVRLPVKHDSYWANKNFATYEEWKRAMQPILDFRGPKW